ncbi:PREDICTED: THO complex subunit 1 [Drosophila arizonae]|uniref:THO complex subunit 1 n=1 Tax=Drosophila arizonae TaxID=7263 RepID=A0ABM1NLX0_DROAR|nr:PREDICTED: THO complex subunit 1 [Drosophila arizonae]
MSTQSALADGTATKSANFFALQAAFESALEQAIAENDVEQLIKEYHSFRANSEHDKRSPMDQAFREVLMKRLSDDVERIGALVRLSVDAARAEIVSNTIPVVLLGDTFDVVTLNKCELIFKFVEDLVEVWKEEIFFASCKNNLLRMCNDLLRRLSRTQNTVFCGRILLFLSKFFPFSERSGLNIVSEFNLDNFTEYGLDSKDHDDLDNKELEDTAEDIPLKIDYDLYCKFWSLQDFFRNPNQCYSKAQWKMFQMHAETILQSFLSFKLEDIRQNTDSNSANSANGSSGDAGAQMMDVDVDDAAVDAAASMAVRKETNFFAKFLTNPKLLALQLSDSNFRRAVLVQFLILFQYLQVSVKFKIDTYTLTSAQSDFIKETEQRVYKLLEETPPNGRRFARTVQHMLQREEMWNNWKNDGCKEFKKPEEPEPTEEESKPSPPKRAKRPLGDCLREAARNGKFYLGNDNLTRLWNYSPDNLQACKSEQRNFLPQLETYLETPYDKTDPAFEWRALRLLARQTPHFFTFVTQPSCKIADYLDVVRKRLAREKELAKQINTAAANASEHNNGLAASSAPAEQEHDASVALQETEPEPDLEVEDPEPVVEEADEPPAHEKPLMVTAAHIEEITPLIGEPWMKVGKKIGFSNDELLFFQMENPTPGVACMKMLTNWISDDDDATLENWAYMLEGLEMHKAADAVKAIIEREKAGSTQPQPQAEAQPDANSNDVEILSD